MVPNLDDPKEQEKLRREASEQSENNEAQQKFELIEERLKAVEGSDVYGLMDVRTMSLVPDLVLPPKFKARPLTNTTVRSARRLTCICTVGR